MTQPYLSLSEQPRPPDFSLAGAALPDQARSNPTFGARYDVASWELLGSGGYAYVGAIHCRDTDEGVAVKIYSRLIPTERQDRVRDEMRNARLVNHPAILRIHTPFFTPDLHWIEMELVRGRTLKQVLDGAGGRPLAFPDAVAIAGALLEALQAAHDAGVVHRDIKPENLILPQAGGPPLKILDFGVSKAGEAVSLTPSTFPGSPLYAAPECYAGAVVGSGADVYSAALVLYELFTGQYPFPLPPDFSVLHLADIHSRRTGIAPRPPRYLVEGRFPAELDEILVRALALTPSERPSAGEILGVLQRVPTSPDQWEIPARPYLRPEVAEGEGGATNGEGAAVPAGGALRRSSAAAWIVALGVVGLVAGWFALRALRVPEPRSKPANVVASLPTPPPPDPRLFHATWLGEGSITLTSALDQPASITLAVPETPYRCCTPAVQLDPGSSVLVWSTRWQPSLPASPPPPAIQVLGSSGSGGQIHTTIPVE